VYQLEGIDIKTTDTAEDYILEETCPGKPFVVYRTEVGLALSAKSYNTIQTTCNVHNVCQLAESEARAVAGGNWEIRG